MTKSKLSKRIKNGVRAAKKRGVNLGRPGIDDEIRQCILIMSREGINIRSISRLVGVSVGTVYNVISKKK